MVDCKKPIASQTSHEQAQCRQLMLECPKWCPPAVPAAPVEACKLGGAEYSDGQRVAEVAVIVDGPALELCATQLQFSNEGWAACNVTVANFTSNLLDFHDILATREDCEAELLIVQGKLAGRSTEVDNSKVSVKIYEQASEANYTGWMFCNSTLNQTLNASATCHRALGQAQASLQLAFDQHVEELVAQSRQYEDALAAESRRLADCNTALEMYRGAPSALQVSVPLGFDQDSEASVQLAACVKNLESSNAALVDSAAVLEICEKNRTVLLRALSSRETDSATQPRFTGSRSKSMTRTIKKPSVIVLKPMVTQGLVDRDGAAQVAEPIVVASSQTLVNVEMPTFEPSNYTVCPSVNESETVLALRAQVADLTRDLNKIQPASSDVHTESDEVNDGGAFGLWQQLVGYLSQVPSYVWAVTGVLMLPANVYIVCKIFRDFTVRAAKSALKPQTLNAGTSGTNGRGDGGEGGRRDSDSSGGVPSHPYPPVYFGGGGFGSDSGAVLTAGSVAERSRTVFGWRPAWRSTASPAETGVSMTAVVDSSDNEPASGSEDVGAPGAMQDLAIGGRLGGVLLPPLPSADQSPTINPRQEAVTVLQPEHYVAGGLRPTGPRASVPVQNPPGFVRDITSGGGLRPTGPRASVPIQTPLGFVRDRRRSISEGGVSLIPQPGAYVLPAQAGQLHTLAQVAPGMHAALQQANVGHQPAAAAPPPGLGSTEVGRAEGGEGSDLNPDMETQHYVGVNAAMRWASVPPPELINFGQFGVGDAALVLAHGPGPVGAMQQPGVGLVGGSDGVAGASAASPDVQGANVSAVPEVGMAGSLASLPPPPPTS